MMIRPPAHRLPEDLHSTEAFLARALVLACLAVVSVGLARADGEAAFTLCEERMARDPTANQSIDCFFEVAGANGTWGEAAERLGAWHALKPSTRSMLMLALLRHENGEVAKAEPLYLEAIERSRKDGKPKLELHAYVNLKRLYVSHRRLDEAEQILAQAFALAERLEDATRVLSLELERINLDLERGADLRELADHLRRLADRLPADAARLRLIQHQLSSDVAYQLGRFDAAAAHQRRVAEISEAAGDPGRIARARLNLALIHLARPPWRSAAEEAIELLKVALEAANAAGDVRAQAEAQSRLGRLLEGPEARAHLDAGLELARRAQNPDALAWSLGALAVETLTDAPQEAARYVDELVRVVEATDSPRLALHTWFERLEVLWHMLPPEEATTEALSIVDLLETWRDHQRAAQERAEAFTVWTDLYAWLAGRLFERHLRDGEPADLELAFQVGERMRARVLLEALELGGKEEEEELAARETLLVPSFASLGHLGATLAEDEALLAFQLAPQTDVYGDFAGGAWSVLVTREGASAQPLRGARELAPMAEIYLDFLRHRQPPDRELGAALHRELLAPALDRLPSGVRRIVLVPDGFLHLLPFSALASKSGGDRGDGAPFGEHFELSIVPSATLWQRFREQPDPGGAGNALVFADPEPPLSAIGTKHDVATPDVAELDAVERTARLQAATTVFGRLPFARQEARAARRHLGARVRVHEGAAASEHLLKHTDLGHVGVLHFAAHAVVDPLQPGRSAVHLSSGAPTEDGLLEPRDIAQLDLDGRLVVLSACDSAAGRILAGEGVMGLGRAFFEAGAATVVGNLWPLRDDDAARFFDAYYRHLASGDSAAGALSRAQRDRRADGAPAAAWAGMVVLGRGDLVPFPGGLHPAPWRSSSLAAGLTALLIGVYVIRRAYSKRRQTANPSSPSKKFSPK